MATDYMNIPSAEGDPTPVAKPNANGRKPAADSRPVALSDEDLAALSGLATALGEVQATPTANTVLSRLKTIAEAITAQSAFVDGLEGLATSLNGYVDTLETLIGSTNSLLTTQNGYVDGLETLITTLNGYADGLETLIGTSNTLATSLNTYVDQLEGYVDGIEGLVGTTNTSLATIAGHVDGLEAAIASTNSKLDTLNSAGATVAEQEAQSALLDRIADASEATVTTLPKRPLETATGMTHGFVTSSSSGEQDMVTATASQTSRIHRMTVTAAAATVVEIRDGASGSALKTIEFPAAGAYVFDFDERPYAISSANTKLVRNSTVATKVTIDFDYIKSA